MVTDITYESKIIIQALADIDEYFGRTVGISLMVHFLKGHKSTSHLWPEITTFYNYGILNELDRVYLSKVINYLCENDYLQLRDVTHQAKGRTFHRELLMLTNRGRNFLNSDKLTITVEDDVLYRRYLMHGILQFDVNLYNELLKECNHAYISKVCATYLPSTKEDLIYYINDCRGGSENLNIDNLLEIIKRHKDNIQHIPLVLPLEEYSTKTFYNILQLNKDKIHLTEQNRTLNDVFNLCWGSLGIYANSRSIAYAKEQFNKILLEVVKQDLNYKVQSEMVQRI